MRKCESCGKILSREGCSHFCSYLCCKKSIDKVAQFNMIPFEIAEAEINQECGECVY